MQRHFFSTLHPLSPVIFATATVVVFVLLHTSRFNFQHSMKQCLLRNRPRSDAATSCNFLRERLQRAFTRANCFKVCFFDKDKEKRPTFFQTLYDNIFIYHSLTVVVFERGFAYKGHSLVQTVSMFVSLTNTKKRGQHSLRHQPCQRPKLYIDRLN